MAMLCSKLTAPVGETGAFFGGAVATASGLLVVGEPFRERAGSLGSGAAYLYRLSRGGWVYERTLSPPSMSELLVFGKAVAISGDTVVVGAPATMGAPGGGRAFVFTLSDGSWVARAPLAPSDPQPFNFFGETVAISGDTIVVGAPGVDDGGTFNAGAAYVFERDGVVWTQRQRLTLPSPRYSEEFGLAVAIRSNTIVVTTRGYEERGTASGTVHVFERGSTGWESARSWRPAAAAPGDSLGSAVSLSPGGTIVAGAPGDSHVARWAGAAHVSKPGDVEYRLDAGDGVLGRLCGSAVCADEHVLIVGGEGGHLDAPGAAYLFRLGAHGGWDREEVVPDPDDRDDLDYYGAAVAISEDMYVVGAPGSTSAEVEDSGAVYVFWPEPLAVPVPPGSPTPGLPVPIPPPQSDLATRLRHAFERLANYKRIPLPAQKLRLTPEKFIIPESFEAGSSPARMMSAAGWRKIADAAAIAEKRLGRLTAFIQRHERPLAPPSDIDAKKKETKA